MNISGIQKFSLIDYPGKISAVIFTQGCNFRCPYCHNPELLETKRGLIDEKEILDFLETRKNQLDAVVITGGEPTLQLDLINFLKKVNKMGFLIKLDTNGSNFRVINKIIKLNLVDYVAMDIKGPINKYGEIAGVKINMSNILKSIDLIRHDVSNYEFRTTVTREQLNKDDIKNIGFLIKGVKKYFLQNYVCPAKDKNKSIAFTAYKLRKMNEFRKIAKNYSYQCLVR